MSATMSLAPLRAAPTVSAGARKGSSAPVAARRPKSCANSGGATLSGLAPRANRTARLSVCRRAVTVAASSNTVADSGLSKLDASRWVTGLTPNNNLLRLAAVVGALALFSQGKALGWSPKALTFLHQTMWAVWLGSTFYTTFVAGLVMFKNLPRQTFRDVQEVLFPAYFQLHTLSIALLAVLAPLALGAVTQQQWVLLGVSMAATLANLAWLEPVTTAVMKKRADLEKMTAAVASAFYPEGKEAGLKAMGKQFGMYHGLSSTANLVAMCTCITYGYSLL